MYVLPSLNAVVLSYLVLSYKLRPSIQNIMRHGLLSLTYFQNRMDEYTCKLSWRKLLFVLCIDAFLSPEVSTSVTKRFRNKCSSLSGCKPMLTTSFMASGHPKDPDRKNGKIV